MNPLPKIVAFLLVTSQSVGAQELRLDRSYPEFGVGPTGIVATIEGGHAVTVARIVPGTAAGAAGLQVGDVLTVASGLALDRVMDPRVPLGNAIGLAEADDGRLQLAVLRDGETHEVTVRLPALGGYAATWPEKCQKSDAIVAATARYVVASQNEDGAYVFGSARPERDGLTGCLAGLFLLSTGDDAHLPNVRRQVHALGAAVQKRPTHSNWHLGYQGILLAEYYLRTGDAAVLPGLEALCAQAIEAQAAGAWGHGGIPGPGYVQSGLMNSAGGPVVTTLVLARECGIEVDADGYRAALELFYRMAGHGCIPYGDHRSELWWSNTNGRNGMLACAFSLLEERPFQRAAEHLALLVTDSYHQPEFGHTGGGFNVIWRGLASVHVPRERRSHYQRQMRELAWYYDLCRQPGGGFSMLPTPPDNKRYQGLAWGTGAIGLTYTAPRRTLRITGAPRTKFSERAKRTGITWGTAADREFLSTRDASGFGEEREDPREVYARLLGKKKGAATVEFCARHLRHYSPLVRSWAARALGERNDAEAHAALAEAARDADPRVRRAAFDGVSGYDNWSRPMRGRVSPAVVSSLFLPAIVETLKDGRSAWWEIDGALFALGRARPEDVRANLGTILKFGRHEEWYLREAAFWALIGLGDTITGEEFREVGDAYARSRHVFERASFDGGFRTLVKKKFPALDSASRDRVVTQLGEMTHSPLVADGYGEAGVHEAAHRAMMILKHFDNSVYALLLDEFDVYLEAWVPYHQHSKWLISGSKWQHGLLHVLDTLGARGAPLHASLKGVLDRYGDFDEKRMGKDGKALEQTLRERLAAWYAEHGAQ
ncbi:MAG: hypothetical protein GY711_10440 [bacterium]|nr:hypothetical protein [bacterium]